MRRRGADPARQLATLLFTDIVGSTELAARLGDRAWKTLLNRHNAIIRRELKNFQGRELDTAGDGFFAIFDRPAQAIECALAVVDDLAAVEIPIRAGIHTGEVEVMGDKVGGIAVHAAARVLGQAGQGEILVTGITHDLVAGSEIRFADRGTTELRGVPGEWRVYAVEPRVREEATAAEPEDAAASKSRRRALIVGAAALVVLASGALIWMLGQSSAPPLEAAPNSVVNVGPATNSVLALTQIDDPTELVFDDQAVWVLSLRGRNLIRVDPSTGATAPVGLPATPTGLAAADDAIWITTGFGSISGDAGVVRVGTNSRAVEDTIPLNAGVDGIAAGEGALWVINRVRNTLTRIDLTTLLVSGEIDVGEQPEAVAVGDGSVWVAHALDRTVWRIDPRSLARSAEITLSDAPYDVALGFGRLWVTSTLDNSVSVIDTGTNRLQRTIDVAGNPRGISAGSASMWVAIGAGAALAIDPSDPARQRTIDLGGAPFDVVAVGDGAWVSIRE